jgi:2-keto-4-pentenoate hydratase/2-oxohepta-3-ene-1,7-dioic acid hydratase in catechol pathway
MQSASVGDLIFTIADTISYLSRWYTFLPGDILLTGTPSGVGIGRKPPVFIEKGDVVNVDIDRIGTLTTHF